MVRVWRNSDDVRPYMQYQQYITPEQQLQWFYSVNNNQNYYFIAYHNDVPFGVFNIKNIDYIKKTGETGSFLKDKSYWESGLALRGSFAQGIYIFETLKLETNYCHVLKENKKAIAYNRQMGFKPDESFLSETSIRMTISKEMFYLKNKKIINFLDQN